MRSSFSEKGGIYLHVPFCRQRCGYCAFYTAGLRLADWAAFREGVERELTGRLDELTFKPDTIYIGGGTPSLIPAGEFRSLAGMLLGRIGISKGDLSEFTIEVNPDDVDEERADAWVEAGVNRVSMGVQSFDAGELSLLGRSHNPGHVESALRILRERFDNLSVDLIYNLPGQRLEAWERNLRRALDAGANHISLYSLSFEEKSGLTLSLGRGEVAAPDEDAGEAMNRLNDLILGEGGFLRYETSNYARTGYESVHNSRYWSGAPYLGLGPSASSYDGDRRRRSNAADLRAYLRGEQQFEEELLNDEELREEYLLTRLRRMEGLELDEYADRFGERARKELLDSSGRFVKGGELEHKDGRLRPTPSGLYILDYILAELL